MGRDGGYGLSRADKFQYSQLRRGEFRGVHEVYWALYPPAAPFKPVVLTAVVEMGWRAGSPVPYGRGSAEILRRRGGKRNISFSLAFEAFMPDVSNSMGVDLFQE